MKGKLPMHLSARCSATSKRTRMPCQAPAVTGWTVCRFHGARGGGPKGDRNGAYRHGMRGVDARTEQQVLSQLVRQLRRSAALVPDD